eukprot:Partr_v1_DN26492_c0_g1_i7_m23754 putative cysteine peptidase
MRLHALTTQDGTCYRDDVCRLFQNGAKSLILFIPVRLGAESLNHVYHEQIRRQLTLPTIIGISGGRPNSALYFVGIEGDDLILLDPHHPRASLDLVDHFSVQDLLSYHCDILRRTSMSSMDPSLVIGHYFCNCSEFDDFFMKHAESHPDTEMSLFSMAQSAPVLDDNLDLISMNSQESN